MKEYSGISDAEWQVMQVIWEKGRVGFQEIREALESTGWSRNTITTLISRLVKKGIAGTDEKGHKYVYFPLVTQDECRRYETMSFLEKVYSGSAKLLVTSFLKNKLLTDKEADELFKTLEEYRKEE